MKDSNTVRRVTLHHVARRENGDPIYLQPGEEIVRVDYDPPWFYTIIATVHYGMPDKGYPEGEVKYDPEGMDRY